MNRYANSSDLLNKKIIDIDISTCIECLPCKHYVRFENTLDYYVADANDILRNISIFGTKFNNKIIKHFNNS